MCVPTAYIYVYMFHYAFVARRTGIVDDETRKTQTSVGALAATVTAEHTLTAINLTAQHATHSHAHTQAFTNIQHI